MKYCDESLELIGEQSTMSIRHNREDKSFVGVTISEREEPNRTAFFVLRRNQAVRLAQKLILVFNIKEKELTA